MESRYKSLIACFYFMMAQNLVGSINLWSNKLKDTFNFTQSQGGYNVLFCSTYIFNARNKMYTFRISVVQSFRLEKENICTPCVTIT